MDKRRIIAALRAQITEEAQVVARAAASARDAATHEEAKPENDKDTRALEASYLAGAQLARVRELEKLSTALEFLELRDHRGLGVAVSALVLAEVNGVTQRYFLVPFGGGTKVTVDGAEVQIVSPESPIGRALVGREAGDSIELRVPQGKREIEIVEVT